TGDRRLLALAGLESAAGDSVRHRLIALVGALLVLSACQPASPAASPGASAGGAVKGGTLVFAIWQEPTTLAPHYVNQTVAGLVSQVCVEGLGRTDTDGNYQ